MNLSAILALPGAAFLLDVLAKSVVLLLAAGLVTLFLRRSAAATRHLIWLCALVALLLLPVLSPVVPGIPVPGLSWNVMPPPLEDAASPIGPVLPPSPPAPIAPATLASPLPPLAPSLSLAAVIPFMYGVGILVILAQVVLGVGCVRRFEKDSVAPDEDSPLYAMRDETAAAMGVSVPIRLRLSESAPVPMTWGWRRPTVLLPLSAVDWSPERVRVALLHEMAHIARGDWGAQMLAHFVCALYWFHPLVWIAVARLRVESERAADDRVLLAGIPAADYAQHLLEIAQSLRPTHAPLPTRKEFAR
jgi:beta-lactamase regulating signal transducer with metallopeptidase domain